MTDSSSYADVLRVRGIKPFLSVQFLNAFNDNVYKLVVSLLAVSLVRSGTGSATYLSLAGFIFVAPFLLFSGYAGQLADRFEKRNVVVVTKAFEIAAMIFAVFALASGSMEWMLAVLFFTATQAAFFSPAKYGIVPEIVEEKHLARANGLLEMSTFVAIIFGTVAGTNLVALWKDQPVWIGFVLVAIAIVGTAVSLRVTRTPRPALQRQFSYNPLGDVIAGTKRLRQDRTLKLTVLGTTFFWFLGALFQMVLLLFGSETLHCTETQIGLLLASLAIGIADGSMAAGRLSGEKIEPGLIPIGAAGMAVSGFFLAFVAHAMLPATLLLAILGFMGGLFAVPLNAILQHRPQADEKGRLIATANFVNTIGVMLASGVVWLLHEVMHLSATSIVAVIAALTLVAAWYTLQLVPNYTARFVLWFLTHVIYRIRISGRQNVPQRGAALLVANHVSFVDGFLIGACIHRFVRFMVDQQWYDRFAKVFSLFCAIRVPSGNGRAVLKAIELARQELEKGHVVCIFAEGSLTTNGNIGEFHRGLERIVNGLDVPIIPVHLGGVWGSIFSLHRRASLWRSLRRLPFPISVSFGQPMIHPTAFEVRQAVSVLSADAAVDAIGEDATLAREFVKSAKRHWRQRAMMDSTGRTLTYGQSLVASRLLACYLQKYCGEERMIGVMLPASVAAALANLGTTLAGKVPVNLNFTAGRDSVNSAVAQCELKTIFTSKRFLAKANIERRPEMIFVEDVFSFGRPAKLAAFLAARMLPASMFAQRKTSANDLAAILFSSGSTGVPKGVMLSHRNLLANAQAVHQLFPVGTIDAIAGVLPLFHSFGFTYTLWFPLLNGASAAYHPQPLDARGFGELVRKAKATFLPAAPTFCQAYLRGCSAEQFATLRHVLVGAERLSPALAKAFEEKFGIALLEGYGATEMAPVIAVNVPDCERQSAKQIGTRRGTVGRPIPGVAARVIDRHNGAELKNGEEGLLLVKGPNRMLGYLHKQAETESVLRDGWYVTGDIVTIDEEGFITIVDRESRFSKIGGEMVPHAKVEEQLQSAIPGISCAVTAVSDERRGERLVAFVADRAAEPKQIWQLMMVSGLPKLWVPKLDDIRTVDQLPLLGTGKIDLRMLKQLAMSV